MVSSHRTKYNMILRHILILFLLSPTEQLTGVATTNVIPLGSLMPIWAAVEQKSHQPLLLLIEECVAATTPELQLDSQVYPIIGNKGYDSDMDSFSQLLVFWN